MVRSCLFAHGDCLFDFAASFDCVVDLAFLVCWCLFADDQLLDFADSRCGTTSDRAKLPRRGRYRVVPEEERLSRMPVRVIPRMSSDGVYDFRVFESHFLPSAILEM